MQFAAVTVAIVMGAIAERGRVLPAMVFTFLWTTLVYCPIAHWVWGVTGWAFKWGVLDYAGKNPTLLSSLLCFFIKNKRMEKRKKKKKKKKGKSKEIKLAWSAFLR